MANFDFVGLLNGLGKTYALSQVTSEQLDEVFSSGKLKLLAAACAAIFVSSLYQFTPYGPVAALWAVLLIATNAICLFWLRRWQCAHRKELKASRTAALVAGLAAFRGLIWAIGFAILLPVSTGTASLLIHGVIAGIIFSSLLSYWAMPLASLVFANIVMAGCICGFIWSFGDSILTESVLFAGWTVTNCLMFLGATKLKRQADLLLKLGDETEKVNLLLDSFAYGSKDWLWRCDASNRLQKGIKGFEEILQLDSGNLEREPFPNVLRSHPMSDDQLDCVLKLEQAMALKKAFSRLEIRSGRLADEQFLSLSAIPKFGKNNEFLGWHGVASNTTIDRQAEERTRWLAMFDSLTGLPNRVQFRDKLGQLLKLGDVGSHWLIYGDVDGFKQINDTLGHAGGDFALKELSKRFKACISKGELVARVGGDEFVFLVQRDHHEIFRLCHGIITTANQPLDFGGRKKSVGISLGLCPAFDRTASVDDLMRKADVALYYAKKRGRGTAVQYSLELEAHSKTRQFMEASLQQALAQGEFEMHYQPILQCSDEQVIAAEALLRWTNTKFANVSPSDFILAAEECGFVAEIGAWVLKQACQDLRKLPKHVRVCVNLSAVQLQNRRILNDVLLALAESGVDPTRLELEVTETAVVQNFELAQNIIFELKQLGIAIALDDFGMGYSTLGKLSSFKFDKIKIDKHFVQHYATSIESKAVIDAVLMLARRLGIKVVAEGVETHDQYENLLAAGCDQVQGYLFAKAMPIDSLVHRLSGMISAPPEAQWNLMSGSRT